MRLLSTLIFVLFTVSCTSQPPHKNNNTLVLKYEDFGPQVIAHEIIGMEWWKWESHGNSRPTKYNIQVVVYRGISFDEVSKLFPVNRDLKLDYRYLKYADAIYYLENRINENIEPSVTERLKNTLSTISASFE